MSAPGVDEEHEEVSADGRGYHPKQAASDVVPVPDEGKGFLVEAFVGSEDVLADGDVDYERVANWALNEVLQFVDSVSEIGVVYTGMHAPFTKALERVIDDRGVDTVVEPCYPAVEKYVEAGVEEYEISRFELFSKRNRQLAREHVDVAVAVTDKEYGEEQFTDRLDALGVETVTADVTVGI